MKLAPARLAELVRDLARYRVVLLYGDDVGMIRYCAETLVRAEAGSLDDPFLVAELAHNEMSRLAGETASLPLTGRRCVVRVREASDRFHDVVKRDVVDSSAPALVVLEAPGLETRSHLRRLLDNRPDAATIGCYPEEGRAREETIRRVLGAATVGTDQDALTWLTGQLGADQASTRAELEKLALYAGPGGRVDLDMAMHCVGDAAGLSLDDALFAATAGDLPTADRALELAVAEGAAPVGVLRAGLMHLQRLYRARLLMETGISAGDAAKAARPPVFFRRVGAFTRALNLWSSSSLAGAMAGLSQAERNCKRTGAPDHTLSRHAVLTLARRAMAAR
jgi:DNA polymerase III subunit delta